jgi:glyoxylase-like metal-dependent hydrolase (beta-lactamase superfamily II)
VVNTGKNLVLFDTGMGSSKLFGPTTGRQQQSLREAGISPAQIDSVVLTHAHIDHIGGMVDAKGRKLFPSATIYIMQSDFDYWTDESDPKKLKDFVAHARKNLLPYRDRIKFIKDGEEFLPGITAMAAPGHTVGHTVFMLNSEGKSACFIGDLTHHQVLLVEKPRLEFAYDTDPKQAVSSRVRILDMLAAQKIPLMAYHFPWPGLGHVAKQGDGFRYFAAPMELVSIPAKPAAAPAAAAPAKK